VYIHPSHAQSPELDWLKKFSLPGFQREERKKDTMIGPEKFSSTGDAIISYL
jgi:hypothetical protein